jgi:GntR family transcriptional regulator
MRNTLHVDLEDAVPIWRQIEQGLRRLVASRALDPGAPVPSVRELARELRINPATVSKAYQRLTADGVLAIRRGEGTFVAADPPVMGAAERKRDLREGAMRYASLALTIGAGRAEAAAHLDDAWDALGADEEGKEG